MWRALRNLRKGRESGTFDGSLRPAAAATPVHLFFPYTTTLIELTFNREPVPPQGRNKVLWFLQD